MIVMLEEYDGEIVGCGDDPKKLLDDFYGFQPNDDTDTYLYDTALHRSARVRSEDVKHQGDEYEIPWQ